VVDVFSDVRYVDQFQRYSRSKSKVVRNCAEIWTFFGPPKFSGAGLPKVVRALSPLPRSRRLEKFREDTHTTPELIEAHTLNCKPNFKFSRLNFFGVDPRPSLGVR